MTDVSCAFKACSFCGAPRLQTTSHLGKWRRNKSVLWFLAPRCKEFYKNGVNKTHLTGGSAQAEKYFCWCGKWQGSHEASHEYMQITGQYNSLVINDFWMYVIGHFISAQQTALEAANPEAVNEIFFTPSSPRRHGFLCVYMTPPFGDNKLFHQWCIRWSTVTYD